MLDSRPEHQSPIGDLKTKYIDQARHNLQIGSCFSSLYKLEDLVSRAKGIDSLSLWVSPSPGKGEVAQGEIVMRVRKIEHAVKLGTWRVYLDGTADVAFGDQHFVKLKAFPLELALKNAWNKGDLRKEISKILAAL